MWTCSYCSTENSDSCTECRLCDNYAKFERATVSPFSTSNTINTNASSHGQEDPKENKN